MRALGPRYLTDCLVSAIERRIKTEAFRNYRADCLRLICTALGAKNLPRFRDILHPTPADSRPGLEIAEDWLSRHGFTEKTNEPEVSDTWNYSPLTRC